jgi:nitrogen fixation NifU-like protein
VIYSEKVLDHFYHPRHLGEIAEPSAVVEVTNPVCGDVLKVWVTLQNGKLIEVKFKVEGCIPAIACGSWLAEWMEGKSLDALKSLVPAQIEQGLEGLPAASRHACVLAAVAAKEIWKKLS